MDQILRENTSRVPLVTVDDLDALCGVLLVESSHQLGAPVPGPGPDPGILGTRTVLAEVIPAADVTSADVRE